MAQTTQQGIEPDESENGEDDDDEKDEEWCEEEVSSVHCIP